MVRLAETRDSGLSSNPGRELAAPKDCALQPAHQRVPHNNRGLLETQKQQQKPLSASGSYLAGECVARGPPWSHESTLGGAPAAPCPLLRSRITPRPRCPFPAHRRVAHSRCAILLRGVCLVVVLGLGAGRLSRVPLQRQHYCRFPHSITSTFNIYSVLLRD